MLVQRIVEVGHEVKDETGKEKDRRNRIVFFLVSIRDFESTSATVHKQDLVLNHKPFDFLK